MAVLRNVLLRRRQPGSVITIIGECFYDVVVLLLLFTLFRGPLQAFVTTLVQYSAALAVAMLATTVCRRA